MNVSMFLTMLFLFSGITTLVVEAEKKICEEHQKKVAPNTLALITACIIGWFGTWAYYILTGIQMTAQNALALVLMGLASGLCSMVGYDKVIQTLEQLKG